MISSCGKALRYVLPLQVKRDLAIIVLKLAQPIFDFQTRKEEKGGERERGALLSVLQGRAESRLIAQQRAVQRVFVNKPTQKQETDLEDTSISMFSYPEPRGA